MPPSIALGPLGSKHAKPVLMGLMALLAVAFAYCVYKVVTYRPPVPKIPAPVQPRADCTKKETRGEAWADPLLLRCGRVGDDTGSKLACIRILANPAFADVKTCWDPRTIGQSQAPASIKPDPEAAAK